jgi:hypothetical protein
MRGSLLAMQGRGTSDCGTVWCVNILCLGGGEEEGGEYYKKEQANKHKMKYKLREENI